MNDRVTITVEDGIADVRLARPDKMNALDPAMFEGIAAAIDRLKHAATVRCVVLSGEGKAFCAGLDMAAMANGGAGLALDERSHGIANGPQYAAWGWHELPMPVIAAIHGVAFGGGFQIVAGADIRIAHPETRFSIREAHWGLVPDMAGIALWRTLARDDVLRELTYTAREFDAAEALQVGLITRMAGEPLAEAMALARIIAGRSPQAIRGSKRLLNLAADGDAGAILRAESEEQMRVIRTPNQIEQVMAHMQQRSAVFED